MDTKITFIKTKFLIFFGAYWAIFLWLGVYFNGGFGEVTNHNNLLMIALGNGGIAIGTGLSLISKNVQERIIKEGIEFKYSGILFLFLFMSITSVASIYKLLN